jgi:hypothetical protein
MPNKRLMGDLRSVGLFCGKSYHKKYQLHSGAIAGRYVLQKEIYGQEN